MNESQDLLRNVKELLELDQAAGVHFYLKNPHTDRAEATPLSPASSATPTNADSPPAPSGDDSLPRICEEISTCQRCKLCSGRTNTVPGEGHAQPPVLFIGEGPGADEDAQGRPFVGAAGQLLTKMINAMGFAREDVYIANVVKCRPPNNRTPEPDEVNACLSFLERQIAVLKPQVICTLGNTPLRALTGNDKAGITRMRGQKLSYRGITMIPTFHPSYLLRNAEAKKPCWEDLKLVLKELGREPPARS